MTLDGGEIVELVGNLGREQMDVGQIRSAQERLVDRGARRGGIARHQRPGAQGMRLGLRLRQVSGFRVGRRPVAGEQPGLDSFPPGQHVASLFCQQFAPELPDGRDWDAEEGAAADCIIDTVEAHAPGFRASIVGRQIISPKGLERKFGLVGGDIMHGKMSLDQLWSARPVLGNGAYRGPLKGLYMCGAGTHPGGGVTGAPGHNAAKVILRDRGWFAPRWA